MRSVSIHLNVGRRFRVNVAGKWKAAWFVRKYPLWDLNINQIQDRKQNSEGWSTGSIEDQDNRVWDASNTRRVQASAVSNLLDLESEVYNTILLGFWNRRAFRAFTKRIIIMALWQSPSFLLQALLVFSIRRPSKSSAYIWDQTAGPIDSFPLHQILPSPPHRQDENCGG